MVTLNPDHCKEVILEAMEQTEGILTGTLFNKLQV